MTNTEQKIRTLLTAQFNPVRLDIMDESARHAGHAGARPGGGTHFRVTIVSAAFEGLSRIARQRAVYGALDPLMGEPIHALAVSAITPAEAAAKKPQAGA